ncbi:MAG: hypothetical protein HKN75_07730 [Bacteroidia bacterium]|nr:hypothetical protein [Bacteroidia bacterium]
MPDWLIIVITGLLGLFALYQSFIVQNTFAKYILYGLFISLVLIMIPNSTSKITGFIFQLLIFISFIYYGIKQKDFSINKRLLIVIPTFLIFLLMVFAIQHWKGTNIMSVMMIIPIVCYGIVLLKRNSEFKNEFGIITIINFHSVYFFVRFIIQ